MIGTIRRFLSLAIIFSIFVSNVTYAMKPDSGSSKEADGSYQSSSSYPSRSPTASRSGSSDIDVSVNGSGSSTTTSSDGTPPSGSPKMSSSSSSEGSPVDKNKEAEAIAAFAAIFFSSGADGSYREMTPLAQSAFLQAQKAAYDEYQRNKPTTIVVPINWQSAAVLYPSTTQADGSGSDEEYDPRMPLIQRVDPESQLPHLSKKVQEALRHAQLYIIQGRTTLLQKSTIVPALVVAGMGTNANLNIYMFGIMKLNDRLMNTEGIDIEDGASARITLTLLGLLFGLDALGRNGASFSKMMSPSTRYIPFIQEGFGQRRTWGRIASEWGTVVLAGTFASPSAFLNIFYMWQNMQVVMRYHHVTDPWNPYTQFIAIYGPFLVIDQLVANGKEMHHFVNKYLTRPIGNAIQWCFDKGYACLGICTPEHPLDVGASLRKEYRETFKTLQKLVFLLPPEAVTSLYDEVVNQSFIKKGSKGLEKRNLEFMDTIRVLRLLFDHYHKKNLHANAPHEEQEENSGSRGWKHSVAEATGWSVSLLAGWGRGLILWFAMKSLVEATNLEQTALASVIIYTLTGAGWGMSGKLEKEYARDQTAELLGVRKAHSHTSHPYIRMLGLPLLATASVGTVIPYVLAGMDAADEKDYTPAATAVALSFAALSDSIVSLAGYRSSWRRVALNAPDYLISGCCPSVGYMRDQLVWQMKKFKRLIKDMDGQTLVDMDAVVRPQDKNNWYDEMLRMMFPQWTYAAKDRT